MALMSIFFFYTMYMDQPAMSNNLRTVNGRPLPREEKNQGKILLSFVI